MSPVCFYNLRARFTWQVLEAMTSLDWSGDVTPSMHFKRCSLFNTRCIKCILLWWRLSDRALVTALWLQRMCADMFTVSCSK